MRVLDAIQSEVGYVVRADTEALSGAHAALDLCPEKRATIPMKAKTTPRWIIITAVAPVILGQVLEDFVA
jgi:hypothetical protein